jgi:hypothetical protein
VDTEDTKLSSKTITQIIVLSGIVGLAAFLGYWYGTTAKYGARGNPLWRGQSSLNTPHNRCLTESEVRGTWGRHAHEGKDSDYVSVLEKNHLEEKGRKIASVFTRSEIGHALTQFTTLIELGPENRSVEGRILGDALKLLESEPREAFSHVREALSKMGSDFGSERQFLYQLVARLDLDLPTKVDFFSEQFAISLSLSDAKQTKLSSSLVLLSMMQVGMDPSSMETVLKRAFESQSNYGIRSYILSVYESKYPEAGKKIRNDLQMFDF